MRTLPNRRGFTLIELLVTMGLIILLLSIAVAVSNSATLDSYKINGAGDRLSQSLITAKSRAARDKVPRGIRLLASPPDASGVSYYRELIYIEQPDPFLPDQSATYAGVGNTLAVPAIPVGPYIPARSQIALCYRQNTAAATNPPSYPKPLPNNCSVYLLLTANDYSRFQSAYVAGQLHVASSPDMPAAFGFTSYTDVTGSGANSLFYGPSNGLSVLQLNVTSIINPDLGAGQSPTPTSNSAPYQASLQSTQFGVYLPARPLAGEPSIILSKNAAVDPNASSPVIPAGNTDILFAPAGQVMFRPEAVIAFLIRDTYKFTPAAPAPNYTWLTDPTAGLNNYRSAGEMLLVTVYPRTGTVSTKPVAEPDGTATYDPFRFTKDAINGGL